MEFEKTVPQWDAAGTEPPSSLKASGFTPGYKPPADYFNWFWHSVSACLTELQTMVAQGGGTPIAAAESTDGVAYTATVDGVDELYDGLTIRIIPNIVSSTLYPTLNVNGLGDIRIGMLSTFNNAAVVPPSITTWLSAMRPVEVTFHQMRSTATGAVINQYWIVEWRRPSASGLYGQVPVQNGGWYVNSDTTEDDKAEAREALGVSALGHTHAASEISAGTFARQVVANSSGQTYSTSLLRNSKLVSADTNPTVNGEICWTYK